MRNTQMPQITNTLADGKVETVTITVPAVKMTAIAAGISPTYYNSNEEIKNSNIIVKGIYSDGSVKQIMSGYTIGTAQTSANGVCDIPISYNGFNCSLRIYKTGRVGTYSEGAVYKPGNNTDILVVPDVYQSVNTGINISLSPVSSDYAGVTVTPQQPEIIPTPEPTTSEPTTSEENTSETISDESITEDTTTENNTTVNQTTEELTSEFITTYEDENSGKIQLWQIGLIIMVGVVGITVGAAGIILFFKMRNRK